MVWQEIFMIRRGAHPVPKYVVPEPFTLRNYCVGDEENWFRIYKAADNYNRIYSSMFREYFGADQELLARRQFYLCDAEGTAIGTASAWLNPNFHGEALGRVHWVAILPEYQGRGLSKPLISAVCQRLLECGHQDSYLRTISVRITAIRLYLGFGFLPDVRSPHDAEIWQGICKHIPDLALLDPWR